MRWKMSRLLNYFFILKGYMSIDVKSRCGKIDFCRRYVNFDVLAKICFLLKMKFGKLAKS